jgi:single-stranded-DNA-specific exonuclease
VKIKQIGERRIDIVETILVNRGIVDRERFLNPNFDIHTNPYDIKNLTKGLETVFSHVVAKSEIGILVDCDVDGYSSASIMYQYLKSLRRDLNIHYFLHDRKTHGLTKAIMEQIANTGIKVLIIPDAGTNDKEQINMLYTMGIDVVVIDHHELEDELPTVGIIINNQLDDTNKNFVGAGMTWKFVQALDNQLNFDFAWKMVDLVAIGQIADVSDISEPEIRSLVTHGLKNINNPFIRAVLSENFDLSRDPIFPQDISFKLNPLINAVVRVGTMEEKEFIFKALNYIDGEKVYTVEKKKKNKVTGKFDKIQVDMNIVEYAVDICKKCKAKQDKIVKKTTERLTTEIINNGVAIGFLDEESAGLSGLIAGKLSQKFEKPVLLVKKNAELYVGSGRGNTKILNDFKQWCNDTGVFKFAQGHANAFGVGIELDKIDDVIEKTKTVEQQEQIFEVDLIVDKQVDLALVDEVDKAKFIIGGKVNEPLFAFTNINISKKLISQKATTLNFYEGGMSFVQFGFGGDISQQLKEISGDRVIVDFVGTLGYNTWSGINKPQMIIKEFVLKEVPPVTLENIEF